MSESVTKTLLPGSGSSGFTKTAHANFDSAGVGTTLFANEATAVTGEFTATFQQGSTYNKYSDWGVPIGAKILGLKLLSAAGVLSGGPTASGNITFFTIEAALGSFDANSIGEGVYQDVSGYNLDADDYVRVEVSFDCAVTFTGEGYSGLDVSVSYIQIEVTYQRGNKGGMFFGV